MYSSGGFNLQFPYNFIHERAAFSSSHLKVWPLYCPTWMVDHPRMFSSLGISLAQSNRRWASCTTASRAAAGPLSRTLFDCFCWLQCTKSATLPEFWVRWV